MAIVLIVEDGTNVANANSYETLANARIYASNRGVVLSSDDDILAAQMILAFDYLEAKACKFQGYPFDPAQSSQWPRIGVYINCLELDSQTIPKALKSAQVQLAMAIEAGINIFPNVTSGDFIIEEKVGPITTKYADPTKIGMGDLSPQLTAVNALLEMLYEPCVTGMGFRTVRV